MNNEFFEIYFSDLNEDAQKRLLEAVGETDPKEMNWDIDMCPIALYPLPFKKQVLETVNSHGESIVVKTMAEMFSSMLIKTEEEMNAYLEGLKSLWDAD